MLTNRVSILETHFFRFFHVFCNSLMFQDQIFYILAFKKDTDLKKRAALTGFFGIQVYERSDVIWCKMAL